MIYHHDRKIIMNVSTQIKALVIQLADIEQVSEVKQKVTRHKNRRKNDD